MRYIKEGTAHVVVLDAGDVYKAGYQVSTNTLQCLKKATGLSFGTFLAGYFGQGILGSKFQMRHPCLTLSNTEYAALSKINILN